MMYEFSQECVEADAVFGSLEPCMRHYLGTMEEVCSKAKSEHYMANGSIYGCIYFAKNVSFVGQSDYNSSLATDGEFIYLHLGITNRGGMFKIGTGEGGTIAGKVYLHAAADKEGEVTWVHCKGKLYMRRANEQLGLLNVVDPTSFAIEGAIKLDCGDLFATPHAQSMNRYYPLLSNGENLFIIAVQVSTKKRKLKEGMKQRYIVFVLNS